MRIIGESPSVNEWRQHYLSMLKGERKKKPTSNRARGQVQAYVITKNQTGSGISTPIKVISPVEANVEQAKKLIERKSAKRKRDITSSTRVKRKSPIKWNKAHKGGRKKAHRGVRKGSRKGPRKGVRKGPLKEGVKGRKKKHQVKRRPKSDIFS